MTYRNLSRRQLLTYGGIGAGALALAACGAPGGNSGGGDADPSDNIRSEMKQAAMPPVPAEYQGRTEVLFWAPWTGKALETVTRQVDLFNESQSDIYVAIEPVGGYYDLVQQLTAALQAKTVPDLVSIPDLRWLEFYFADALAAIDSHFGDGWGLESYVEPFASEGVADGHTYAVPFVRSTPIFYYNKTVFEQLGLPIESQYTWSQIKEFGHEISTLEVQGRPMQTMAYGPGNGTWTSRAWLWAWDGVWSEHLDVMPDEDKVREVMEFKREFVHTDGNGYLTDAYGNDFTSGIVACIHASTAGLIQWTEAADFEVGLALMPGEVVQPPESPTGGGSLCMVNSESQERQDAAAAFLRFLAQPASGGQVHVETGYLPIIEGAADEAIVKEAHAANPNFDIMMEQMGLARTVDPAGWFVAASDATNEAWNSIIGDNAEPDPVIAKLRTDLEKILERNEEQLIAFGA